MQGIAPDAAVGRYDKEIAIMKYMNWSWPDLMIAPADLVDELSLKMLHSARWQREKKNLDDSMGNR